MLKFILTLFVVAYSSCIFAKNIELQISTKWVKGNHARQYSSNIVAKIGSEITLPINNKNDMKITIIADDKIGPDQSVYLNNKIYEIKNKKNKLISNPKVIALIGRRATITTENSKGEYLELTILPVKYTD